MTVTIETAGFQELEQLLTLLKSLNFNQIKIKAEPTAIRPAITKGDKKIDPTALFGIWKDNPRSLEAIRQQAWTRNWSI
jgi:hypothetical protein